MGKKVFALLLSLALVTPAFAYSDVPQDSVLKPEIESAAQYGLMNGFTDGTFGYSQSITRAQFATVLVRMFGWDTVLPAAPSYSDLSSDSYYFPYIESALVHDVFDAGTNFRPGDAVTRGEMAEMLVRALGLKSAASLVRQAWKDRVTAQHFSLPFTDVSGDSAGYIYVAYSIGMTNGTSATTFSPNASATRAQAAAMLVRIYEKIKQDTTFNHAFYAISSYSQLSLSDEMDAVSVGWSRMSWDRTAASLATTSANGNEYCIPSGYSEVTDYLSSRGIGMNLSVFMDTSGGLQDMLSSDAGRTQAVEQIVNELTITYNAIGRNPYSGVTIDFEGLRSAQREDFNRFLVSLSSQLKAMGKSLYVCVSPVLVTGSYYDGYDYAAIGDLADRVILMAYDYDTRDLSDYVGTEYYKTAVPAPIDQVWASLKAITDPDTGVRDRSRVSLGFSAKQVAWQIDENGKLLSGTPVYPTKETVSKRLAQADTVKGWSSEYQMSYAIYRTEDGSRYFLWYESREAVEVALNAAKSLGVTGISLWRLGTIPDDALWSW
ncbi:S-layer homology domain-containing protein [Oscillibacter sp. MSJ-2]|uniref:S-layer homology domain-containing protein n=1 Tax=Dysosmobacter acutus TaxID=2841504 RepID=A0ABS6FC63_9FIRM|nr:S-layer homology domain-containing protein [Dysosmobacter acutus]MBU5627251.1 S-layer homology domain-containing protein [Dysosmobacter acutus]